MRVHSLPRRIRGLPKDERGYPVPYVIMRDIDNTPIFTINDDQRVREVITERRCAICGIRIGKRGKREPLWFVGGPLSAFHEDGAYMDTAMHHECAVFALQVCPYLAAPKYLKRIDLAPLDPAKLPPEIPNVFMDPTVIPERPPLFVAVASMEQDYDLESVRATVKPRRPYVAVEYWRCGRQLTPEEGELLSAEHLTRHAQG